MEATGKQFSFYGKNLSYDEGRVEYNRLRHLFESFAENNAEKIYAGYDKFGGLDEFYEGFEDWIVPYFLECCDIAVAELCKLKCYDTDRESYFTEVFDAAPLAEVLEPIDKFYEDLEEQKEARREAHANRFRAGTSLREDYSDGSEAALSVVVNMHGGMAALAANGIANGFNFIADSCNKSELYEKSREPVVSTILYCLGSAYWELINYAGEHCSGYKVSNISKKDRDKAAGILKNLVAGNVPEEERIKCLAEIMLLDPYVGGAYEYTMLNYGDPDIELQKLADFFYIEGLSELQVKLLHDYYKTIDVSTEETAQQARALMKEKAAFLGIADYSAFPPLERRITDLDLQYRTVCGIVRDSRKEADAQRELYKFYQGLDFESGKSAALASRETLRKKAAELKISADWLEPYIECSLRQIQKKAVDALDEFYKSLVIDSEEKALATRKTVSEKAAELEIDDFKEYAPLEELIKRYDLHHRTVGGKTFETRQEAEKQQILWSVYTAVDYRSNESAALELKKKMAAVIADNGIDGAWLTEKVDAALKRFDEEACTRFEYRFASREEAQNASTDETLFFRAVWTCIAEFARENSFLQRWSTISADKQKVISEALGLKEQPFAFMHTTMMSSGKTGLAFTPSGLTWNNGSALMLGIANNAVFKTFFKKKAQDMQEQYQMTAFSVSWKELFESDGTFAPDGKNNIVIVPGKTFEAAHTQPQKFCELLKKLYAWGKETRLAFSGNPVEVPDEELLHKAPELPPMPAAEDAAQEEVKQLEEDFVPNKISVGKPQEPFPDNTVILQCIAKYRQEQTDLMIAPDIKDGLYKNFLSQLAEDVRKSAESEAAVCLIDHASFLKDCNKGVLLTSEALYCHNGDTEWRVVLSDIIDAECRDKTLIVTCADLEYYCAEGAGMQTLAEILGSALLGKGEEK